MPEGLPLGFCIFTVLALPFELIPLVGPVVAIPGVVMLVMFVAKASAAVQALIDAGQQAQQNRPPVTG